MNGICIGLAGKPNILGRASKVGDFVQVGKDEVCKFFPPFLTNRLELCKCNRQKNLNLKILQLLFLNLNIHLFQAHIETELFNDAGPNIIVHRKFNSAGIPNHL